MDARWTELSSDLSSKDPTRIVPSGGIFGDHLGQLFHGEVVFSIAASDVQMGLIRAGTGDGKGWYTKGAGKYWKMSRRTSPDCRSGESCPGLRRSFAHATS